jgi:hypothetical protein
MGAVFSQAANAVRYSGLNRRTSMACSTRSLARLACSHSLNVDASAASRCLPAMATVVAMTRSTPALEYSTDWRPSPLAAW